jgi:hypothetical protein
LTSILSKRTSINIWKSTSKSQIKLLTTGLSLGFTGFLK